MIVVTGGSGFIGTALCKELFRKRMDFKIADVIQPRNFSGNFKETNITQPGELDRLLHKGDTVVHLAALVNAHESDEKREEYFKVNIEGTFNVVNACIAKGCKIVFTSSVAVYDPRLEGPIKETSNLAPENFYGVTKLICEGLIEHSGIPYVILRPTNAYGPGGRGVINSFVKKAVMGFPMEVWAGGDQERDFIHVDDVVSALLLGIDRSSGTYNISSGENIRISALAELVNKLAGSKSKITFRNKKEGKIKYSVPSWKAKKELGFEPRVSLREGIKGLL